MKPDGFNWIWAVAGTLLVATIVLAVWPHHPKQVEYKVIDVAADAERVHAALSQHGSTGWEFAAAVTGNGQPPRLLLILKKPE
jgi:hypothetical protein